MTELLPPIHPGEILREDVMEPLGLSQNELARELGVPPSRINAIVRCQRPVTPDTALRLARFLGTSAKVWVNIQADYDLELAERKHGRDIKADVKPRRDLSLVPPRDVPNDPPKNDSGFLSAFIGDHGVRSFRVEDRCRHKAHKAASGKTATVKAHTHTGKGKRVHSSRKKTAKD